MMRRTTSVFALLFAVTWGTAAQTVPPWSKGANNPAPDKGYEFQVADINNMSDLHGNPADAKLVLFIGGNQFFVLPRLIAAFEARHPELKGAIFYETLPPGVMRRQINANGVITLGNLTLQVHPDVYQAESRVLTEMAASGEIIRWIEFATNDLAIMVAAGNPKHIASLKDLALPGLRLAMPNPQWEGIANSIGDALRKAGGDALMQAVYKTKVTDGSAKLTEIHHRQTPMRIMAGQADAGVTWQSEVKFQEKIGNPISGVEIPDDQNMTAIYAAGALHDARHPEAARAWLDFLTTPEAQSFYREFGFRSIRK
jgi:ABC-type molybdate transport system substrate-binding protein